MIELLIVLVIAGVALYLLNTYVPMAAPIKTIINVVVVLFLIIWLLQGFGVVGSGGGRFGLR
jgi:hypothetical protein